MAASRFDLSVASNLVADATTSDVDLAEIARSFPTLRVAVAKHPAAYDSLLDWLVERGDPAVIDAVNERRSTGIGYSEETNQEVPKTFAEINLEKCQSEATASAKRPLNLPVVRGNRSLWCRWASRLPVLP